MRVYVPYKPENAKSRLSPTLTPGERSELSWAMLSDVCRCIEATGNEPVVLTTREIDFDTETRVSEASLSEAVNATIRDAEPTSGSPVAVVLADLGLVTPESVSKLFEPDTDVVLAPGRRCGTNALLTRSPAFSVDYHGTSFLDHRNGARRDGLTVDTIDSYRLGTDIDEPTDLVELLVHGRGGAKRYLEERFELAGEDIELERVAGQVVK